MQAPPNLTDWHHVSRKDSAHGIFTGIAIFFNGLESPGMANWSRLLMVFTVQWTFVLGEEYL